MPKIFRLQESSLDNNLTDEQKINFHKALSMGESYAKKFTRPQSCLICNSTETQFCNSHSVPARCLRAIAKNGHVKVFNGLIKIPAIDDDKGINEAGTFRLICRECDEKVFKDYETFENYPFANPSDKILHEIALKNYLKYYHKKSIEAKAFPKMLDNLQITNQDLLEPILKPGDRDKKDAIKSFCEVKKLLSSNTNGYYRIIEYTRLSYTCPFAFQSNISLITGFDGEVINDIFNFDKKYDLQDLHICIFPEKDYTYVIVFYKKHFQRYSQFSKHYSKLNLEERLQLLLFIILKYSEDYFYSPSIQNIEANPVVQEAITSTTMMFCDFDDGKKSELKKCIQVYDLNNYRKIPNVLSNDFKESN